MRQPAFFRGVLSLTHFKPWGLMHTAVSEEIRQRHIDPMVDFAFGILLGSEANKPVLIHFTFFQHILKPMTSSA